MTYSSAGQLVVGPAAEEDWPVISGWAHDEGWNPGISDGRSFFAQDPEGFFLGRLDGEPVSAVSVVNYGARYAFLGCYLVRPDLRGRGHGLATWQAAQAHAGTRTIGLDGVVAQQDNYRKSGFTLAHTTFRHTGVLPPRSPAGVRQIRPGDHEAIAAYDSACYPADRPTFLKHWLTTEGHRAFVRFDDGQLTGYAVVRPAAGDVLRIGPLFANSPADAAALYGAIAEETGTAQVAVDVPESNPAAVALARALKLTPSFETARMYTGPIRPVADQCVYGITTLELG
ncbi:MULTISPECIES: GNAT family N-acetyltransferase [unclassified Streptomyces]|uniref:GNAT family N-acetyltransferase n=1 Tax=unclassified Streptomyces TaxID=2593676 RepID=UPI0013BFE9A1|nr:GNAT family N-acetyltransferase [Streptomyces sp. SID10853]NDZ83746.1 GNAT family N-acetyltransferase [Streptomyces sp. SID10853]WSU40916.1 GNAT family N-acetyltransferase [Streptomyces sp. NBC_01089]